MYQSKARATPEEVKEITALHKAASAPMIMLQTQAPGAKSDWKILLERLDKIARAHGLADQPGEWGFDSSTGEFLSKFPIVEETLQ